MSPLLELALASTAFVGAHLALSHPLRRPLVRIVGEGGFLGLYSLVALATLLLVIRAWRATPPSAPFWPVGDTIWAVATIVMLFASVLLLGSLVRNPANPNPAPDPTAAVPEARGVFAVTRHPMMWAIALWAGCHLAVYPVAKNAVLTFAMLVLALVGAALQDRKKAALRPAFWPEWERRTSYMPFVAIAQGRARLGGFGMHALAGGTLVWLAATWAHIPLAGWAAGIWRWI